MPSHPPTNNPYAKAASAYGDHAQKHTTDQREMEGRVLLKAARMMQDLHDNWEGASTEVIEATLKHNRTIWLMFHDTAMDNPEGNRPKDLRSNIVNLANFVFKREMEIMSQPGKEKLKVLININKEIAAGLMTKTPDTSAAQPQTQKT